MKVTFLVIILGLFFIKAYSQKSMKIEIDYELQLKYQDTLQAMEDNITGHWKYLGKRNGRKLKDTVSTNYENTSRNVIVENGIVFEVANQKKTKTNYYFETIYDFKNEIGFYSSERKYINNEISAISSYEPFVELVYYKEKFGIIFTAPGGKYFEPIRSIYGKKLIFENGEEYLRL